MLHRILSFARRNTRKAWGGRLGALAFIALAGITTVACGGDDSAAQGDEQDLTVSLKKRTLGMYASNIRARHFIHRLLEGHEAAEVLELIKKEIAFIDGNIETLIRTHYEKNPQRVAYMAQIQATRQELVEFQKLVPELQKSKTWKKWFPAEEICHHVEVVEFEITETIAGVIEEHTVGLVWSKLSPTDREGVVNDVFESARAALPDYDAPLGAVVETSAIRDALVGSKDLVLFQTRISFVLQVTISGSLTHVHCPGDNRVLEVTNAYDSKTSYNYGHIPAKDIWILRNVTTPSAAQTERFESSDYLFSFQGLDDHGKPLAGPVDKSERVVRIAKDGVVERGPSYGSYFSDYGVELPEAVPAEEAESLVHGVDAYLAGHLESFELAASISVVFGVEFEWSAKAP